MISNRTSNNVGLSKEVARIIDLTYATDDVIFVPPAAPITSSTFRFPSSTIDGHIEDSGIFCGLMKFAGDGGTPYAFFVPGTAKSSMPSFKMIPVCGETILLPNLQKKRVFLKISSIKQIQCEGLQSVNCSGRCNCITIWCNNIDV